MLKIAYLEQGREATLRIALSTYCNLLFKSTPEFVIMIEQLTQFIRHQTQFNVMNIYKLVQSLTAT